VVREVENMVKFTLEETALVIGSDFYEDRFTNFRWGYVLISEL
jgi:hypothetical protein